MIPNIKTRYKRYTVFPSSGLDEHKDRLRKSFYDDVVLYDPRHDEYTVTGVRNIREEINATSDALLTVSERVAMFQSGNLGALTVDTSGVYTDITGYPSDIHTMNEMYHNAERFAYENGFKDLNGLRDALEKLYKNPIAPNVESEVETNEQK